MTTEANTPSLSPLRITSVVLCVLTFVLIVWGGHVNTTQSGMAFPDWPTSNNNAMLTYTPSEWLAASDKFWEHSHRLLASLVGMITVVVLLLSYRIPGIKKNRLPLIIDSIIFLIVATAVGGLNSMPSGFIEAVMTVLVVSIIGFLTVAFKNKGLYRAHWLAHAAFSTVCLQACFGGYTVRNNLPWWTSTTHGMLAEVFMMMVLAIALLVSRSWSTGGKRVTISPVLRNVIIGTWALTLVQFLLGALTRHTHAYSASGMWPMWSPTSFWPTAEDMQVVQVVVHILHRTAAYLVAASVLLLSGLLYKKRKHLSSIFTYSVVASLVVLLQVWLGVMILFTGRDEIVTTLHVMMGALLLTLTSLIFFTSVHQGRLVEVSASGSSQVLAGQGS